MLLLQFGAIDAFALPNNGLQGVTANSFVTIGALANVITLSNTVIDAGQVSVANILIANSVGVGSVGPLSGNYLYTGPGATYATSNTANVILVGNYLTLKISVSSANVLTLSTNALAVSNTVGTLSSLFGSIAWGAWSFNAFAYDNSPAAANTVNTIANTLTIDPALNLVTNTISNTVADQGQFELFTANVAGGASPYTFNFLVKNTLTSNTIFFSSVSNTFPGNVAIFPLFSTNTDDLGTLTFTLNVIDSATTPVLVSNVLTFTVFNGLTLTANTISNTIADRGQTEALTISVHGGASPYTYNFLVTNTIASPSNVIFSQIISSALTTKTVSFVLSSDANVLGPLTFTANAVDFATTNTVTSIGTNSFGVNTLPSITLTITNTIIDKSQTQTFKAAESGGTGPFTVNFFNVSTNSISVLSTFNTILSAALGSTTTNTFIVSVPDSNNAIVFNIIATDTGTTSPFTFNSVSKTFGTNSLPTLTIATTNIILDTGQTQTVKATENFGSGPFTVNFFNVSANSLSILSVFQSTSSAARGSTTTNTFTVNSPTSSNAIVFNIIATDTGTTSPFTFNSVSNTFSVNTLPTITLNAITAGGLISNSVQYGNTLITNAVVTGGSGPFVFAWTLNNAETANTPIGTSLSSNTLTLPAAATYVFNVIANDLGTTSPFLLPQITNATFITKNTAFQTSTTLYRRQSSSGALISSTTSSSQASYQAGFYDIVSILFTGVTPIHNQVQWNAAGSTANTFSWSSSGQAVTSTFRFTNAGNSNYTNYTYTVTVSVSGLGTGGGAGGGGPSPTTTTVATTSTTVTVASTTILPTPTFNVTTTGSGIVNVSSSAPASVRIGNSYVSIYTSSASKVAVNVTASNATSNSPPPPKNYTKLSALNITALAKANVTLNATVPYPCGIPAANVAPYIYKSKNSTWVAIKPFAVSASSSSCAVAFAIPKDPLVGLMSNYTPSTTTVPTIVTTVSPTTVAPTPTLPSTTAIGAIVLVVIVVIIVAYALSRRRKH